MLGKVAHQLLHQDEPQDVVPAPVQPLSAWHETQEPSQASRNGGPLYGGSCIIARACEMARFEGGGEDLFPGACTGTLECPEARIFLREGSSRPMSELTMNTCQSITTLNNHQNHS